MATTWDPLHAGQITFSNGNLTLKGTAHAAIAYATLGIAANDTGDHLFTVTCNTIGFGSTDVGVIIAGQSVSARPDRYNPSAPIDVMMFMSAGGSVFDNVWTTYAAVTGGGNLAVGDTVEVRMKNGFLYLRYKPSGGSFGPYNGASGTYSNATPSTDTGGIPLSPFGSALLFPYLYIEGDTYTGDFTNWTTASSTIASPGRATGASSANAASGQQSTQSAAGNAAGAGSARGMRNTGLTISPKNDQLAFHVKAGVGIMWPFLGPTGTDTGVAATSHYDTSPYLNPSNFSTHTGSWLLTTAVAQGFDHVRLQVNPGPIIECNNLGQASRKATLLGEISAAVDAILAAGLKVIVALQLTGFPTGYAVSDYLDGAGGTNFAKYKVMLADVATKFAGYDPTKVAVELMHEPPATSQFASSIPTNAIPIADAGTLWSTLNQGPAVAGGKTYLLAGNTNFGAFFLPQKDFRSNPVRIIGQSGTVFTQLGFGGASGIQVENVTSTGANGDGQCFSVGGCNNITLLNCIADTGAAEGSPVAQGYQVRNATNIVIQGRGDVGQIDIKGCGNAVGVVAPNSNVTIKNLTIRNNGTDGILVGSSGTDVNDRITIDGNLGFDFYANIAAGDHPDWVQFFGNYTNCVVQNNGFYRGIGTPPQGYFFENPTNLIIQNNWFYGGIYNSISVSAGHTVLIDSNYVVGDATYGSSIIVRGATDRATVTNNYTGSVNNYAADGVNTNFIPAVLPGSNHIIGTVALGDYSGLDAWIATIPTTRPRTSALSLVDYPSMLKAMHATVRGLMPKHTIVAAAANYSTPAALTALDVTWADKNTIWTFHWYPLSSVQGANDGRGNRSAKYVTGYDWEKRPEERAAVLSTVTTNVNNDPTVVTPQATPPGNSGP